MTTEALPTQPVVALREVVAVLGDFPALAGADLEVARGEIVLLRGPERRRQDHVAAAVRRPVPITRGTAHVVGHDLATEREAVRRRVGLLGHQNGLYRDLSVAENIRFWGSTVGATEAELAAAMQRLGVDGRIRDVAVGTLSAGQRRRTALACLVARRAELWLLDEPHAGLDAAARDELDTRCARPRRSERP